MEVDLKTVAAVKKTEAELGLLPNEILESILSFFSTETLERTLSGVCARWKALSEQILSRRVASIQRTIPKETLDELKTRFIGNDADLKVLKEYERLYMKQGFQLQNYTLQMTSKEKSVVEGVEYCASKFRNYLISDEDHDGVNAYSLENTFKLIPCHQLLVVVKNGDLIFYHESVISQPGMEPYREFKVECSKLPHGITLLDVYQDKVAVVLRDTRRVILYQITDVCHDTEKLILCPLKRIFFPIWIQAITMFKDKIYVLYTTWHLGMWHGSSDTAEAEAEILTSHQRVASADILLQDPGKLMCRVNNLLFIRLAYSSERFGLEITQKMWLILDMNEESVDFVEVPMEDILSRVILGPSAVHTVQMTRLGISGNILLVHVLEGHSTVIVPHPFEDLFDENVLAFKLKLDPKKEDFSSLNKFKELIDGPPDSTSSYIVDGFLTAFPPSCFGLAMPTFLGISNSKLDTHGYVTTLALRNLEDKPNTGLYIG